MLWAKNLQLKQWQHQGFAPGQLIEWGAPSGHDARSIILNFLTQPPGLVLWIYSNPNTQPYPPAWAARGIPLEQFYFIHCSEPVRRLRPLFLEKAFSIIVLDAPEKVYKGELSFLMPWLRKNEQLLFLIRPYFLSQRRGNPFSHQRINICLDAGQGNYYIHSIRGGHRPPLTLSKEAFYESI
ncbi:MAG: hypothetical protein R2827_11035 [Bdellovibrionales bacterium]